MTRFATRSNFIAAVLALAGAAVAALAQDKPPATSKIDAARVDAVLKVAFPKAPTDWAGRLEQDETMKACSATNNLPPKDVGDAIIAREKATIKYPEDGKLLGDWKQGERIAQSGYGMRFTDYPAQNPNGGNCYACHQLTKQEVSFGTIGVSLLEYGRIRKFREADTKAVYEKIYNSHVAFPCSLMPRFGANGVLTIAQIKDLVALLMDPESPVNK